MTLENPALHASSEILTLNKDVQDNLLEIARTGSPSEQCLAIETAGAWKLSSAREVLLEATRNDDPDVRVDALQTLVDLKEKELGKEFLWSLENDPVGDSKVAAIKGLQAEDRDLVAPLLRKLVVDRCEDDVAWEDDSADWDDWLDVQKEAIRAVGRLGIEEAVDDLLEAATDEFGQDLWNEILEAFAGLGRPGLLALIDAGQSPSERQRARAARALGASSDPLVVKALDALSQDTNADVRLAALETLLERNAPIFDTRLIKDPSASIRAFTASRSPTVATDDLIDLAIADEDKSVKLAAMKRLTERHPENVQVAKLLEHAKAKLRSEPEDYIAALVEVLGRSGTDEAFELLLEIKARNPKPEIQRAVHTTLANFECPQSLESLTDGVTSKSQMVRLSALASLASLSGKDGEVADNAAAVLLLAARGDLASEEEEAKEKEKEDENEQEKQFGARARDDEGGNRNRVVIDREGNVVPQEKSEEPVKLSDYRKPDETTGNEEEAGGLESEAVAEETETSPAEDTADVVKFPQNTLAAILQGDEEQLAFEEESIELSHQDLKFLELAQNTLQKKRVRPDVAPSTAIDIRRIAVRLIGEQAQPVFTQALLTCCSARDKELRASALTSLLRRAERGISLSDDTWEKLLNLPPDNHPPARMTFLELLAFAPQQAARERLENALSGNNDADRIAALKACARLGFTPNQLGGLLNSENRSTRQAAVKFACEFEDAGCAADLIQATFRESGALGSVLAKAISSRGSCGLSDEVLSRLKEACDEGGTQRLIALQILSQAGKELAA
ncbi:HEAT repeat domain-containing protein [Roseibium sp. SCPC15]|uniref:HEAT repeat domain-containing protein n=1 Tax=Roseibium sp. SCP15 TaxID=3141376 RepID=UPI00333B5D03